jgi:hypothetical protein
VLRKASFLLGFSADTDKMSSGACSDFEESAIDDNCQKSRNIKVHDEETTFQLYKCFAIQIHAVTIFKKNTRGNNLALRSIYR